MKKALYLILAAAMLFGVAGCAAGAPSATTTAPPATATAPAASAAAPAKVEEVRFFSSIGAYKTLVEQTVEEFNNTTGAEKGVKIVMETNIDNYATALQTMIQAGNIPDLADMYSQPDLLSAGYARDLYTVKGIEDLIERFKPYLSQGVNLFGDKLYDLPLEILPIKMVYNNDIFKECGLTEPPKTWAQMADYAKIITQKGAGKYYGFGWTTMWTVSFRRLAMKASMGSTGVGWFNNNTGTYDFTPFKNAILAIAQMYQDGSMFPTPMDQHIDPIRNRFAEGLVGMEIAPAYDVSVYTSQFPCKFDWKVCDVPALSDAGKQFKDCSIARGNISIASAVTDDRLPAVIEAFRLLHSKEYYKKLYSNSAIIPNEQDIIDEVKKEGFENAMPNWDVMSDITNYAIVNTFPDSLLTLDGDNYQTVFTNIMLGETTWDKEIASLNDRYNKAYQQAKKDGIINTSIYEGAYSTGPRS